MLWRTRNIVCRAVDLNSIMPPTPSPGLSTARVLRDRRSRPRPTPGDVLSREADLPWRNALRRHWPEYSIEALYLAAFVLLAGLLDAALYRLGGELAPAARHLLAGIAMGALVAAMVYSPWGRRSGTHLNPAITLVYLRLGKMGLADGIAYLLAQLVAGLVGIALLRAALSGLPPAPAVAATSVLPATPAGEALAALLQFGLAGVTMLLILVTSNSTRWFRWTGLLYGVAVAGVMALASPLSDFGINPARLLGVDVAGTLADVHWLNLLPPILGMQLAVDIHRLLARRETVLCAKLAHSTHGRCIFRCQHPYQSRALALESIRRRSRGRSKY